MNIHKKKIVILGFNQAIGYSLINSLISRHAYIVVADIDNYNHYNKIFSSNTFGKVIHLTDFSLYKHIDEADIVINLLTCPTPYNLSKQISKKCKILNNILTDGILRHKLLVSIVPSSKSSKCSAAMSVISPLITKVQNLPTSILITCHAILAKKDSILEDIYNALFVYKAVPTFAVDKEISYISADNLISLLIIAIEMELIGKEIKATNQYSIKINSLIKRMTKFFNIQHEILQLPLFYINIVNLLLTNKLYSFSNNYLNSISLHIDSEKPSIKAQSLLQLDSLSYLFSMCFLNTLYTKVDYRNDME